MPRVLTGVLTGACRHRVILGNFYGSSDISSDTAIVQSVEPQVFSNLKIGAPYFDEPLSSMKVQCDFLILTLRSSRNHGFLAVAMLCASEQVRAPFSLFPFPFSEIARFLAVAMLCASEQVRAPFSLSFSEIDRFPFSLFPFPFLTLFASSEGKNTLPWDGVPVPPSHCDPSSKS